MNRSIRTAALAAAMTLAPFVARADEPTTAPATAPATQPAAARRPQIEVCFVLDTTGSMSGLIEGAKQKIWSIANTIIAMSDKPEIKIALVGYRDRGDAYVTQVSDLTDDIDAVFKNLSAFKADGGGDTPESVNQALNEAVTKIGWSNDKDVARIIFLVGDAPPHMDYKDDVKYPDTVALANKRDIVINAVQCGTMTETTPVWQEIARGGHGAFIPLAQEGGMVAVASPQDKELAELNAKLANTVVAFGAVAQQKTIQEKVTAASLQPAAVAADRAAFVNKAGIAVAKAEADSVYFADGATRTERLAYRAVGGDGDLVWACTNGDVKIEDVKDDQLPEFMKKMTMEERKAYVAKQNQARAEIQKQITELSRKRDEYVAAERARLAREKPADAFDEKVTAAVREQAEAKRK